jgi:preprotein translocase subunit SecD
MAQTKTPWISFFMLFLLLVNLSSRTTAGLPLVTARQNSVTRLGLRLLPQSKAPVTDADIEKTMAIICLRIEKLSSISITVERSQIPGEEIVAFIPVSLSLAQVKEAIVNPGRLELKLLARNTEAFYPTKEVAEKAAGKLNPAVHEILPYNESYKEEDKQAGWIVVERKSVITASDMQETKAIMSSYSNVVYEISFLLKPESAMRFGNLTGEHIGDSLAIVLNGEVKSVPRIQSRIKAEGQISGNFTKQEAEKLAAILSSGELPHELSIVNEKVISSQAQSGEQIFEATIDKLPLVLSLCGFTQIENR